MDPPGTVQFMDVHPTDSRYGTVLQIIRNSFLDPHYQPSWVIHSLQTVKNLKLFQHYKTKSEELKLSGRDVTEYDMFTCYKTVDLIKNILEHGLQTRHSSFNFLGNSQKGVNLCRHADIQLKAADNTGQEECYLIIYKVMLGKALPVYPSPDNEQLAPTENFDSHISSLGVDRTIPLGQQAIRSQVFCYEYINGQLSSCPRHVLPYVVVCYKRPSHATTGPSSISIPLQIQRPTMQPPPPPLVQMAPAPQPPTIPGMYQPHSSNDISKMPAFQPRLPPRNPFRTQHFPLPACPPPPFQGDHRTQYTRGQGIPTATACQAMPNLNLSSSGLIVPINHQPTTGMRLPYISPPPPLLDNGNHLMFSHPSKSHFQARPPTTSHPQLPNQQNFSMFHSSARPVAMHSGMSIPLQLPVSETMEGISQPASCQKKEITGMRLPIIIQPEEPTPEETTHLNEQLHTERQDLEMHAPTVTTNGPSVPSQLISRTTNSVRPMSPVDIKPDISKILLKISKRKPTSYENIIIDDEVLPGPKAPDKNGDSIKIASTEKDPQQQSSSKTVLTSSNNCQNAMQTADLVSEKQVSVLTSKSEKLTANDNRNDLHEVHSVSCTQQTTPASSICNVERKINAHGHHPGLNCAHETVPNEEEIGDQNQGHCKILKKLHLLEKTFPQSAQADDDTLPDLDENDSENADFRSGSRVRDMNGISGQSSTVCTLPLKRKYQDIIRNLKRRRTENPFLRKRANLFKFSDKRILNTLVQYPVRAEKSVYEFRKNGSVKMFYDASCGSRNEQDKENINKQQGMRLLFDKRLCQMEIDFLLKDIGAESVIFEHERLENTLHIAHSNEGSPTTIACKEVQQVRPPVNADDTLLDIETVKSDNQSDDQSETQEVKDVWGTVVKDQRFQPKVIVKDIRSCSGWETFVTKEKVNSTLSEASLSKAESVESSVSRVSEVPNGSELPEGSPGGVPESSKGLLITGQIRVPSCETSVSSEQQVENPKTPNLYPMEDENPICKTSMQNRTEDESPTVASEGNGIDVRSNNGIDERSMEKMNEDAANKKVTCGSASVAKANCQNLLEQLKDPEQSKPPTRSSNSLEINGGHSESLFMEPALVQDLNKDDITEEIASVLNNSAETDDETRRKCSAATTDSSEPTRGLQSDESKETRNDEQRTSKKVNICTGYVRAKKERGRRQAHLHRSYSQKYRHPSYKYRRSRYAKQIGSLYSRDKRGSYNYHRERKRRYSSDRYGGTPDKSDGVSEIQTGSDENISKTKELEKTEEYRSGSEEKSFSSEPKCGCSAYSEAKKQSLNECSSESTNKEDVAKVANEAQVSFEQEKGETTLTDINTVRSQPNEQTNQVESLNISKQRKSSTENETSVNVVEKPVESKLTSSLGLLKTCPEPNQLTTEREAKNVNEKWVETCERLFLGRSGKEGSPLFDGYSASSEGSAAADPSEWLTKLIRINTKRATPPTTQELFDKTDAPNGHETDARNTDISAAETAASKTEHDTPATSADKMGASSPPSDTGSDISKKEKSEVNMSREELSNLVSRALTVLNPSKTVATTMDSNPREAQLERTNASSWQNRLSVKYIHRKRKSLPAVGTQDANEAAQPPKLWGDLSLEKMHRSVTCEEPIISVLPKYPLSAPQTPVVISGSEPDLTSTNSPGSACRSVTGSLSISADSTAQSKDPRLRRLSLSPRAESGSDVESVFHSPLSLDSPVRDSSVVSLVDVDNKINRPKSKISKLWQASISAPKALGNESVAFRELKLKERLTESGHIRRHSSSDRPERKLSTDDRFANYSPWKRELHLIDIRECRCYQYLEQQPESKDPRFNRKWTVHDGELGKRATKHCRNIPLERIRKEQTDENIKHSSNGLKRESKYQTEEDKRKGLTRTNMGEDRRNIAYTAQNNSDCDQPLSSLEIISQPTLSCRKTADHVHVKKYASRNPKYPTQARIPLADIGACCAKVRATMEEVWQLGIDEYQSLNKEMIHLLKSRIQRIEDSQMFSDPSKGLDQHERLKLISSTTVSDEIIKELQIEEKMRSIKEKNHHMRQRLDDALKSKSLSDSAIKDLKFQIDIRDIKYEKYNKELEDLGKFYKSSVVEVLPDMFRLNSEKNKFISAEGNMLFLLSPLKEADCKRLLALIEEIKECKKMLDNPGSDNESEQHARLCLGWLHGERKEMLCQLCLNMYRTKQALLQRFLDKRTWCSKAESVLQLRHEKDDLKKYIKSRYQRLGMYISVLKNVQRLDNGVWTVKTSKCCGEPEAPTNVKCCDENITESSSTHFCKMRGLDGTSSDSHIQIDNEKGQETVKISDEDESKTLNQTENKALQEDDAWHCKPERTVQHVNNTGYALKTRDEQVACEGSVATKKDLSNTASQREEPENIDGPLQSESVLDSSFRSIYECDDMEWRQLDEDKLVLGSEDTSQQSRDVVTSAVVSAAMQYWETSKDLPMSSSHLVSQHHFPSSFNDGHDSLEDQSRMSPGCNSQTYINKLDDGHKQSVMDNRPENDGNSVEHEVDDACDAFASYGKFEQMCKSSCIEPASTEGADKLKRKRKRRQRNKKKGRGIGVAGSKTFLGLSNVVAKAKRFRKSTIPLASAADTTQYSSTHFDNGAAAFPLSMDAEQDGHRPTETGQYGYVDSTVLAVTDRCERGQLPSETNFDHNYYNDRFVSRPRRKIRPWSARKRRERKAKRNPDACRNPYQQSPVGQRPFHGSANHRFGNRGRPASYYDRVNVPSRFQ